MVSVKQKLFGGLYYRSAFHDMVHSVHNMHEPIKHGLIISSVKTFDPSFQWLVPVSSETEGDIDRESNESSL